MSSRLLAVLLFAIISIACGLLPAGQSPAPSASAPPTNTPVPTLQPSPTATPPAPTSTPAPSATPAPTSTASAGFYLRAWYTQAIPPQYTFSWPPPFTITDGLFIDGNVAVPAIYPGPLLIVPVSSTISDAGIATIIDEADRLGLLGDQTDFTGGGAMPGAKLGQIEMIVDGKTYELTGNPDLQIECIKAPCEGAPGSPEAFAAFWRDLMMLDPWLSEELGTSQQYLPERVALLLSETDIGAFSPPPTIVDWPLDTTLADATCLTLAEDELATMLPVLQSANQLTIFGQGSTYRQPTARVLVPGELSPCDASR